MSVHIRSTNPMKSLKRATRLVNTNFKILHTTIQVEDIEINEKNRPYKCAVYH
jgi:hypothetical protein